MKCKVLILLLCLSCTPIYSKVFDFDFIFSNYNYLYNYNSSNSVINIDLNFTLNYKNFFSFTNIPCSIDVLNTTNNNSIEIKTYKFEINDILLLFGYNQQINNYEINYFLGCKFDTSNTFLIKDSDNLFIPADEKKELFPFSRLQFVCNKELFIIKPAIDYSFNALSNNCIHTSILALEFQTIFFINKDISCITTIKESFFNETKIVQTSISSSIDIFFNDKFSIRPGIELIYNNSSILLGTNITFSY